MIGRITVDLDNPSRFEIVRSWYRISDRSEKVKGRVSSSGEGIHLIGEGAEVQSELALKERMVCLDDPSRIEMDQKRPWRPSQVLFDSKTIGGDQELTAGDWVESLEKLLGEYNRNNPYNRL